MSMLKTECGFPEICHYCPLFFHECHSGCVCRVVFGASPPLSSQFLLEGVLAGTWYIHRSQSAPAWIQLFHKVLMICTFGSSQSAWCSQFVFWVETSEWNPPEMIFLLGVISAKEFGYWQIIKHCERVGLDSYFLTSSARICIIRRLLPGEGLVPLEMAVWISFDIFSYGIWNVSVLGLLGEPTLLRSLCIWNAGQGRCGSRWMSRARGQIVWVTWQCLELHCDYASFWTKKEGLYDLI